MTADPRHKPATLKRPTAEERRRAWKHIQRTMSRVVDREPNPELDNRAEEEAIAESIKELRRQSRHA